MALSHADIGRLTIDEVESIVERATIALNAFKQAQALLGAVAPSAATQTLPAPQPAPTVPASPRALSQEQMEFLEQMKHQKAQLMQQFKQDNDAEEAA